MNAACKKDLVEKKRKHALKRHILVMNNTSHNYIFSGNFHMYQSKSVKTPDGTERLHYSLGLRGSTRGPIPCPLPAAGFLTGGPFYYRTLFLHNFSTCQVGDIYPLRGMKGRVLLGRWKIKIVFIVNSFPSFSYRILFTELVKSSSLKFKVYDVFS